MQQSQELDEQRFVSIDDIPSADVINQSIKPRTPNAYANKLTVAHALYEQKLLEAIEKATTVMQQKGHTRITLHDFGQYVSRESLNGFPVSFLHYGPEKKLQSHSKPFDSRFKKVQKLLLEEKQLYLLDVSDSKKSLQIFIQLHSVKPDGYGLETWTYLPHALNVI